jgi:hypothetical protein
MAITRFINPSTMSKPIVLRMWSISLVPDKRSTLQVSSASMPTGRWQANIGVFRAARDEILKLEQPPVSTAVGVPELARPGTLVEN